MITMSIIYPGVGGDIDRVTTRNRFVNRIFMEKRKKIKAIVAYDENFGIGINGNLPWNNSRDLQHFKIQTKDHICIMGRTTWESLPNKRLPGREIWVCTQTVHEKMDGVQFYTEKEIRDKIYKNSDLTFMICGGIMTWKTFQDIIDEWIITEIPGVYECDTFFDPSMIHNFNENLSVKIYQRNV